MWTLTSTELADARKYLIKGIQCSTYREEPAYLLKGSLKCPPLVRQVPLFLDHDKLFRCGGRIHNAPASELAKFPYRIVHLLVWLLWLPTESSIMEEGTSQLQHWGKSIGHQAAQMMCHMQQVNRETI